MARQRVARVMVTRVDASGVRSKRPDRVIVEEPLTIQLDGEVVTTTMRTPGNDFELAAGFCFTEGLLAGAPVTGVRYCADGPAIDSEFNVVTVETGGLAPAPTPRLGTTSSSCGLCGRDQLDALTDRLKPFDGDSGIALDVLAAMPNTVLGGQGLFGETGAVHAAAAFDASRHGAAHSRGRRPPQRRRQGRRRPAARRTSAGADERSSSACSSAVGHRSRWSRRRGPPASGHSSPSALRPRSPSTPPAAPTSPSSASSASTASTVIHRSPATEAAASRSSAGASSLASAAHS